MPVQIFFRSLLTAVVLLAGSADPTRAQTHASPDNPLSHAYLQTTWTIEDGLPQNSVTSIVQTRDGYLWLGTFGGLARFDGLTFTVFDLANTPGLASSRLNTLYEARDSTLWIGHQGGALTRYKDGVFTSYTSDDGLPGGIVYSFAEDPVGHLWVGTGRGLVRFADGVFTRYTTDDGLPANVISSLLVDRAGTLWVGTGGGLARYAEGAFTVFTTEDGLLKNNVMALFEDRAGTLWAGTAYGLARYTGGGFTTVTAWDDEVVSSFVEDQEGTLWIGTWSGLFSLEDGATTGEGPGQITRYRSGVGIRAIFEDREKNLWLGTAGNGLHRLRKRALTHYTIDDVPDTNVLRVTTDGEGSLWISSGCNRLSRFRDGT